MKRIDAARAMLKRADLLRCQSALLDATADALHDQADLELRACLEEELRACLEESFDENEKLNERSTPDPPEGQPAQRVIYGTESHLRPG